MHAESPRTILQVLKKSDAVDYKTVEGFKITVNCELFPILFEYWNGICLN